MGDNHYLPNANNAHIDTSVFVRDLKKRIVEEVTLGTTDNIASFRGSRRAEIYQYIYDYALSCSNSAPEEPTDDAIVCRFLTPEKFLWLIDRRSILLSSPRSFDDDHDCALHDDFNNAILRCLPEVLDQFSCNENSTLVCEEWASFERRRRGDWLISCWTNLTEHKDDKLIWYKYANGPFGVGITARYGDLRDALHRPIGLYSRDQKLAAGSVNYNPQNSKLLPFNKRNGFRGEKEIRFAIQGYEYQKPVEITLSDTFFELFNLRVSEDSPEHHKLAVKKFWVTAGGNPDCIEEG